MKSSKPPWISSVWFAGNNPTHALTTWKALKQKLSTKDKLIKMGAVIDPICPLCKSAAESIDHLFFKCSYSAWLWKSILWRNGHYRAKNQSLLAEEDWLRHHSKGKGQAIVAFKLCFSSLIHNIWMERNRRIFESSEKHKRLVLNQILTEISIKMNGLKIKDKISPRNISTATNLKYKHILDDPSSRYCSWSPPNEDELKLNSNASLDSLGGGLGGLIRDNQGMIKNLFSINVDKKEIYELELQAIERGIVLALSMNCLKLWIESDSKLAVDIILGIVRVPLEAKTNPWKNQKLSGSSELENFPFLERRKLPCGSTVKKELPT
ncbi:uncharacterized protein LOC143888960 [Tasmannia lanceolata]|uniref:uncharacterized protein LOC143859695 n=1 Tax=Tasmannia lanceolata TaxID=3420 RepID=UPI0040641B95